jgi:hypothetical protein
MNRQIQSSALLIAILLISSLLLSCRNKPRKESEVLPQVSSAKDSKTSQIVENMDSKKAIKPEEWTVVERIQFDWNGDSRLFELVAEHTTKQEGGGDFTRVSIFREGKQVGSFEDKDGLTSIKDSVGPKIIERAKHNLLNSKYFLALPEVKNPLGRPLLFLFGYAYASDPGSLHILELRENATPYEIHYFQLFYLADFTNHNRSIVGGGSTESFGPCFEEYNPFFVYSWASDPTKGLVLDEELCKEYNHSNYYGWAGLPAGKSLVVVLRPPQGGKPIILPKAQAEALFSKP